MKPTSVSSRQAARDSARGPACPEAELLVDASLLLRVAKRFRGEMENRLEGTGINGCQVSILRKLDERGGMTQGALSSLTGVDRTALVSLIDALEEKNCVTRNEMPDDRRANRIELTSRGREMLERSRKIFGAFQKAFFGGLTDAQKLQLNEILRGLA